MNLNEIVVNRLTTGADTVPSSWQPVDDWGTLTGCPVEVHHRGQLVDLGTVECVTHDGSLLWLHQNGAVPRRIIERSPDVDIRLTDVTRD